MTKVPTEPAEIPIEYTPGTTGVETRYDRNFDTLLLDGIELLLRARDDDSHGRFSGTLARASIVMSLLLLETAANICLQSLALREDLYQEFDRLPVLGKFDVYLMNKFRNRRLDRNCKAVFGARELKRLRDGIVHLKLHPVKWEVTWEVNGSSGTAETRRTNFLKVASNPNFWGAGDATVIMRAVHDFLFYFFRTQCKYSRNRVASMLFSEAKIPSEADYFVPSVEKDVLKALKELKIRIDYVAFG